MGPPLIPVLPSEMGLIPNLFTSRGGGRVRLNERYGSALLNAVQRKQPITTPGEGEGWVVALALDGLLVN